MNKLKLLCLSSLAAIVVSSTPVFAASNQGIATVSSGQAITVSANKTAVKKYNYENAPANIILKLKDLNVKLSPDIEIFAPAETNNTNASASSPFFAYNTGNGEVTAYANGNTYYANIYSNVIGYGHQTSGSAVGAAQVVLYIRGYNISIDSQFGSQTQRAVLDFQDTHGLARDGIIGLQTWSYLV